MRIICNGITTVLIKYDPDEDIFLKIKRIIPAQLISRHPGSLPTEKPDTQVLHLSHISEEPDGFILASYTI